MVVQKKAVGKRAQKGSAQRSKTGKNSSCVRVDDRSGLSTTIYWTKCQTARERSLFYDTIKRYEHLRRGGGDGGGAADAGFRKRLNYPRIAESISLEPLPMDFGELTIKEKKFQLIKLCEAFVKENASKIVGQDEVVQDAQDVDPQVDPIGESEFDEGCAAADLGPVMECNNGESSSQGGYPLQDAHWNQQGNPQGRPPTSYDEHAYDFLQCMSQFKLRACRYPDLFQEYEALENQVVRFFKNLEDRELSIVDEVLEAERRSPHSRSREMEIPAQLVEDISGKDMPVELDKLLLMEVNVKEIHSPVCMDLTDCNLMMDEMDPQVTNFQACNKQFVADYLRIYGGYSPLQCVSAAEPDDPDIGHDIAALVN